MRELRVVRWRDIVIELGQPIAPLVPVVDDSPESPEDAERRDLEDLLHSSGADVTPFLRKSRAA